MKRHLKNFYSKYRQALLTLAVIILLVLLSFILWHKLHPGVQTDQQKLQAVTSKVGKLMLLPTDENPTLATVTDKSKLTDKFLAAKAENGDRILIYAKNHTVIIYRPGINKIAAVGTVSGDPAFAEAQGATLTVLDSTNSPAKTQKIIDEVKAAYPDIKISNGGKTNRQDFPYTIVIDNTDQKNDLRAALMKAVPGKQGFQPPTENQPTTDLTIIVGQD